MAMMIMVMEKGVFVPDVSSPSLFTIQECVFIDIGKHKGFYAPKVEKSTKKTLKKVLKNEDALFGVLKKILKKSNSKDLKKEK